MESIVLVLSIVLVVAFAYVLFFGNKKEKGKKSYYLKRFLRNKEQSLRYINEVEALMERCAGSNLKAFPDREITFSEYLKGLKNNHGNDFSDSTYKILKRNRLNHFQKQDYTKKFIEQSENLYLMEVDLGILNKTWKKSASLV